MCSNNIRKMRKKANLSQVALASMTGLSSSYLSHLEKGSKSNPSFSTMKKIAIALNCNITDIFS